jgi:hypothetical protein
VVGQPQVSSSDLLDHVVGELRDIAARRPANSPVRWSDHLRITRAASLNGCDTTKESLSQYLLDQIERVDKTHPDQADSWKKLLGTLINLSGTGFDPRGLTARIESFRISGDFAVAIGSSSSKSTKFRTKITDDALRLLATAICGSAVSTAPHDLGKASSDTGDLHKRLLAKIGAPPIPLRRLTSAFLLTEHPFTIGPLRFQLAVDTTTAAEFAAASELSGLPERAQATTALTLRCVPAPNAPPVAAGEFTHLVAQYGLLLSPEEVAAVVTGKVSIKDIIAVKLFRGVCEKRPYQDFCVELDLLSAPLAERWPNPIQTLGPDDVRPDTAEIVHPRKQDILRGIEFREHQLVVGTMACGKSTLIRSLARQLVINNKVRFLDFHNNAVGSPMIARTLLFDRSNSVFLVDNLQSYPSGADLVIASLAIRNDIGESWYRMPAVAATVTPELADANTHDVAKHLVVRQIDPRAIAGALLQRDVPWLNEKKAQRVLRVFGGDLRLLSRAISMLRDGKANGTTTTIADLMRGVCDWFIKDIRAAVADTDGIMLVLVVLSSLGEHDLPVSKAFVQTLIPNGKALLDTLIAEGLVYEYGFQVRLAPKPTCEITARCLCEAGWYGRLFELTGLGSSADIVSRCAEEQSAADVVVMLNTLIAEVEPAASEQGLPSLWKSYRELADRLQYQQERDATWGNNPSSCMYACQAFGVMGMPNQARDSLRFLREIYSVVDGHFTICLDNLTTKADNAEIGRRMAKEQPEVAVDLERFHTTWLAGVCLSAEAAAGDRKRISALANAIIAQALPSGGFYPERIPWVTARMLRALGVAGYSGHRQVRRASEWLLNQCVASNGQEKDHWVAGTGGWNSDAETTAMAIMGLMAVGHGINDPRLRGPRAYLRAEQAQWEIKQASPIDTALAVRALLALGEPWSSVAQSTIDLAKRAVEKTLWDSVSKSAAETLEQSSQAAQVAADLIRIILQRPGAVVRGLID